MESGPSIGGRRSWNTGSRYRATWEVLKVFMESHREPQRFLNYAREVLKSLLNETSNDINDYCKISTSLDKSQSSLEAS